MVVYKQHKRDNKIFCEVLPWRENLRPYEKCERKLKGWLHTHDQLELLDLGDVKETITTAEINREKYEEVFKFTKYDIPMIFVLGDGVTLVSI